MVFSYALISTTGQHHPLPADALSPYCRAQAPPGKNGAPKERPALQQLLARLPQGNTLVVWKISRHNRFLKGVMPRIKEIQASVDFINLTDHLDRSTAQGQQMVNLFASLTEFERDIIRERMKPRSTTRKRQATSAESLAKEAVCKAQTAKTVAEISQLLGGSQATIYRCPAF